MGIPLIKSSIYSHKTEHMEIEVKYNHEVYEDIDSVTFAASYELAKTNVLMAGFRCLGTVEEVNGKIASHAWSLVTAFEENFETDGIELAAYAEHVASGLNKSEPSREALMEVMEKLPKQALVLMLDAIERGEREVSVDFLIALTRCMVKAS